MITNVQRLFLIGSGMVFGSGLSLFIQGSEFFQPFFESILLSFVGALCSFFLEFCFREGNIFDFYIKFLDRYFYKNEKNPFRFLYKPLGGCAFCFNVWSTMAFFFGYFFAFGKDLSFLFWILPTIFFSHLILFYTFKHFDFES